MNDKQYIEDDELIDDDEFIMILKRCSMKSSNGRCGLGYEHFKRLFVNMKFVILEMFNGFMMNGYVSNCWNKMRMIPIYK